MQKLFWILALVCMFIGIYQVMFTDKIDLGIVMLLIATIILMLHNIYNAILGLGCRCGKQENTPLLTPRSEVGKHDE